jgi:hypothetical protein
MGLQTSVSHFVRGRGCCVDAGATVGHVIATLDVPSLTFRVRKGTGRRKIYPLHLTFRAREGMGDMCVATLIISLLWWVMSLLRWTQWMFAVTRRVLPLLTTSKMVFDVTRRGACKHSELVSTIESYIKKNTPIIGDGHDSPSPPRCSSFYRGTIVLLWV